jgi:hypothetical protein
MFHLAAWYESIDPAAAYNDLTAVADTQLTTGGDNIQIPTLDQIVALAGGAENAVAPRMRLVAPSLRQRSLYQIAPLNVATAGAVEPGSPPAVVDLRANPLKMEKSENVQCSLLSNPAAAQIQWGLMWLADGPVAPVQGNIFTARGTSATTLVAGTWSNCAITFDENLPRGRYQIVGMKGISAGAIAARTVLPEIRWRPGVIACDIVEDLDDRIFRNGQFGVFGEFEDTDGLTVDFLSVSADTAEIVYLDLIQVRLGP